MTEKRLIIDGLTINYDGIFDLQGLLDKIDELTASKGYTKDEKKRELYVSEAGRTFEMELRPFKVKTDYYSLMLKVRMLVTDMVDVDVEVDGVPSLLNKGRVSVVFDAWTNTDYEARWESNPFFYFLRNMFDRFIYTIHADKFVGELDGDCHFLYQNVKSYLELHKFLSDES